MSDTKMTAAEAAKRLGQAISWYCPIDDRHEYQDALSVLSSLASENVALKREVEQDKALIADLTRDMNEYHDKAEKAEAELDAARPWLNPSRPKVICFCGSVRFSAEMMIWGWELAKRDTIVLTWSVLPDGYFKGTDDQNSIHGAEVEGVREQLDELHKRKIDLADAVYIVNVGGYVGDSTKSEVAYAHDHGKPIVWLEREHAEENLRAALAYRERKEPK